MTRALLAAAGFFAVLGLQAGPASAACHAFEVSADPATVAEGGVVQVTVTRDGAVGTSQIDVETVDGSARGGADYTAVSRRTIAFTNETSQTFPVQTSDDGGQEGAETFKLHLSNPGGCTVNPNFDVGPDATVTISANDDPGAPQTTATAAPTTAGRPGTTGSRTPTTAPPSTEPGAPPLTADSLVAGSATSGLTTTTPTVGQIALSEEDEGGDVGLIVLIGVIAILALAAAAWWTWQRRIRVIE